MTCPGRSRADRHRRGGRLHRHGRASWRPPRRLVLPQDNTCEFSREGLQTACPHVGFYGTPQTGGLQADLARIPQADGSLVPVPDLDPATADDSLLASLLVLSEVYLTGFHAARNGDVGPGKAVTVIGDGAVGLCAGLASCRLGPERVVLMGRHKHRSDLGVEFGATDVVAERGSDGVERVLDLTDGAGTHVVIEAVGPRPAYEQACGVVRAGGIISRVGVSQYEEAPIGFGSLFRRSIRLTGGPAPIRLYMEPAIEQVLAGEIDPSRIFDRTMPLAEVATGYAAMDARDALTVVLVP